MHSKALIILALSAAITATPIASPAVDPLSAQGTCSWTGYGQTKFRDSYGKTNGNSGVCYNMPGSGWVNALFSAKVNSGGSVCLYTGTSCNGGHQVIDTAGYQDMSNLPAYHTWRCGAC